MTHAVIQRAALACALLFTGCVADTSAEDVTGGGDGYGASDDVAASSNALRLRWRRASSGWRTGTATAGSAATGSAGATEQAGSGGSGSDTSAPATAGSGGDVDTGSAGAASEPQSSEPAPSSSGGLLSMFNGAQCPNNAPTSGACGHYGDQCTYNTSTGTHYCTCLAFAAEAGGSQGWSCR